MKKVSKALLEEAYEIYRVPDIQYDRDGRPWNAAKYNAADLLRKKGGADRRGAMMLLKSVAARRTVTRDGRFVMLSRKEAEVEAS